MSITLIEKRGRKFIRKVDIKVGSRIRVNADTKTESGWKISAGSVGKVKKVRGEIAYVAFPKAMETLTLNFAKYRYAISVL